MGEITMIFNKDLKARKTAPDTQAKQQRKPSNKVMMDCRRNTIKKWW